MIDYTMGDFQILSHNCPAFATALQSAYTSGTVAFNTFADNFENSIYDALESIVIQTYLTPGNYRCLQGIFLNIYFVKASCYKYCIVNFPGQTARIIKIACGSDCCQRHTRVCRKTDGSLDIETFLAPPDTESCTGAPDFTDNPILGRCSIETACRYMCIEE